MVGTMERARVAARSESKKRSKSTGSPPDGAAVVVRAEAPTDVHAAPDEAAPPPPRTDTASPPPAPYTVVARRYRPQRFEDVVGQDHVVRALRNAIRLNRLAQAYLFCGTRGVGKTSLARIFAKCLNCVKGPTEEPCQTCDICQSIALGQDVDVIEIDGASNNGVEQVRELRQNAALRPSRAKYKIYYIDEVHMLSTGAFNALLKTLEEPPPHVKFLFATTEPGKIPITVLSRCQRYDFAGITPELIASTLQEICVREGVEADLEGLQVVARRAGGSLRDAQSLLDRLLASGTSRLTVDVVHDLLGTASDERLMAMIEALADHDSGRALSLLEESAGQGIQPVEVLGGLIDFLRDAMVLAVGAESALLAVSPRQRDDLTRVIARWPIDTIMASLQVLAECRSRMRGSAHGRLLVELAMVRVARLEDLKSVSGLVERLAAIESGTVSPRGIEGSARRRQHAGEPGTARATLPPAPQPVSEPPSRAPLPDAAQPAGPERSGEPAGDLPSQSPRPALDGSSKTATALVRDDTLEPPPATLRAATSVMVGAVPRSGTSTISDESSRGPEEREPVIDASTQSLPDRAHVPPLDLATARKVWPDLLKKVGFNLGIKLSHVEPVAVIGPDVLVVAAAPGYNSVDDDCATPEALSKIEQGLERLTHRIVNVRYERSAEGADPTVNGRSADSRRSDLLASDPLVQKVVELFEARTVAVEYDDPSATDSS
jgi:DNA polymerase-3 subunit gamma/tau